MAYFFCDGDFLNAAWGQAPEVCFSVNSPSCFSFQMAGLVSPIKNKGNIREMKERKRKIYRVAIREETAKIGSCWQGFLHV